MALENIELPAEEPVQVVALTYRSEDHYFTLQQTPLPQPLTAPLQPATPVMVRNHAGYLLPAGENIALVWEENGQQVSISSDFDQETVFTIAEGLEQLQTRNP